MLSTANQGSKAYQRAQKTLSYYLPQQVKEFSRSSRFTSEGNHPAEVRALTKLRRLERHFQTAMIGNGSISFSCERQKTVFPAARSILIRPLSNVRLAPILSGVIELLKCLVV